MKADPEILERVKRAIAAATEAGNAAAQAFFDRATKDGRGFVADASGYAFVKTYDSNTPVTKALLKLGIVRPKYGLGYYHLKLSFSIRDQSVTLQEEAASAAAKVLTEELGQEFFMSSSID